MQDIGSESRRGLHSEAFQTIVRDSVSHTNYALIAPQPDILNTIKSTPRRALPDPSDPSYESLSSRYDTHAAARTLLRYVFPREHALENVWTWRKREDRFVKSVVPEYRDWSNREDELLVRRLCGIWLDERGLILMVAAC
jgi:hypothetical protein